MPNRRLVLSLAHLPCIPCGHFHDVHHRHNPIQQLQALVILISTADADQHHQNTTRSLPDNPGHLSCLLAHFCLLWWSSVLSASKQPMSLILAGLQTPRDTQQSTRDANKRCKPKKEPNKAVVGRSRVEYRRNRRHSKWQKETLRTR